MTLICLCIVYGCFHVQWQSWEVARDCMACKTENIYLLLLLYLSSMYLPLQKRFANPIRLFTSATSLSLCWTVTVPPPWSFLCTKVTPGALQYFLSLNITTQKILVKKTLNYLRVRWILLISLVFWIWYITDTPRALKCRILSLRYTFIILLLASVLVIFSRTRTGSFSSLIFHGTLNMFLTQNIQQPEMTKLFWGSLMWLSIG